MGNDEKSESGRTAMKISLGKEIDSAIGDVIRGLLKRPAEEAGSLVADGIGLLGDKVRCKRELNAQLGLEEVRRQLELRTVDLRDITPLKEEELHLLMNGLSLSDDASLRAMWAGLFAKALEPETGVEAERPFMSVLESLTPRDAKIIKLMILIERERAELNSFSYGPLSFASVEEDEGARSALEEKRKTYEELVGKSTEKIMAQAADYKLNEPDDENWSQNLIRLGVIEKRPFDGFMPSLHLIGHSDDLDSALDDIRRVFEHLEQEREHNSKPPKRLYFSSYFGGGIESEVRLTAFGWRLTDACGVE